LKWAWGIRARIKNIITYFKRLRGCTRCIIDPCVYSTVWKRFKKRMSCRVLLVIKLSAMRICGWWSAKKRKLRAVDNLCMFGNRRFLMIRTEISRFPSNLKDYTLQLYTLCILYFFTYIAVIYNDRIYPDWARIARENRKEEKETWKIDFVHAASLLSVHFYPDKSGGSRFRWLSRDRSMSDKGRQWFVFIITEQWRGSPNAWN